MSLCVREIKHASMSIPAWTAMLAQEVPHCIPVKSIFLSSKNRYIFLTIPADKRLNMTAVSKFTGISRPPFRILRSEKYEDVLGLSLPNISIFTALKSKEEIKVPFQFLFDASLHSMASFPTIACLNSDGTGSVLLRMETILEKLGETDKETTKKLFFSAVEEMDNQVSTGVGNAVEDMSKLHVSLKGGSYSKLGINVEKDKCFVDWYVEIIKKAELIEYYDVSGCYILRPWGYSIWENIQCWFDRKIKALGVQNCYFPILITKAALQREENHLEGFAPEVAWITKNGDCDFSDPIAIRPTSETAMYPSYAKWIRSHRDLPLKLNQWSNVLRWEFSNPTPFIRSREFLWQEGHTAWETADEAKNEALEILDLYREVYEHLLAVPVVKGKKTEKERFPGADITWSIEAFVTEAGRGCQAATSHFLGQNFAKMFEIEFENNMKERQYVWQNSWGFTTRSIGIMIMTHGDSKGLVLPPRVAQLQVVIVPCGISAKTTSEEKDSLIGFAKKINEELCCAGIRSYLDTRTNISVGWKFNHWELKGVPLRIEVGPKELQGSKTQVTLRFSGESLEISRVGIADTINTLLNDIHERMFKTAKESVSQHIQRVNTWESFIDALSKQNFPYAPHCGKASCEELIKKRSSESAKERQLDSKAPSMGAKSLCIPLEQPDEAPIRCILPGCDNIPTAFIIFGRSY
uniref:proline--tRNA ligase n=1 Tax=Perkinsela sp. SMB-60 TaxID=1840652 RepID=A0A167HCP6_9EUGL|nr:bifunctional glutamate/proline-tRNA ligase [Perkinsela sp. SMB-60]